MVKVRNFCCFVVFSVLFLFLGIYWTGGGSEKEGETLRIDGVNEGRNEKKEGTLDEKEGDSLIDGVNEGRNEKKEGTLDEKEGANVIDELIECQQGLTLCKDVGRLSAPPSPCWPPIPARLAPLLSPLGPCMARPLQVGYQNIECHNAGHFFTEDLPNIVFFNVTKICGNCLPTIQKLISDIIPHVEFTDSRCYDDGSIRFNCFTPSICRIFPSRIFSLFGLEDLKRVYNRIWDICGTSNIKPDVDLVIINREGRRHITNIEFLEEALKANQLTYLIINSSMVSSMSQCQIFNTWARGRIATGSYGADFTYPVILQKPCFPMMVSSSTEYFFEYFYAILRGPVIYSSGKYKVIPLAHYDLGKGSLHSFDSWSADNFNLAPYTITEDAINQLLTFIRHLN